MTAPPTGTVTFLFTDIEGSTQRWEHHRAAMAPALDRHNALLDAAIAAQQTLAAEDWSACGPDFPDLRVRMSLHTGTAEWRDGDYFGPPLNRTARLMAAGHGGQILLSLATQQLIRDDLPPGAALHDLGAHRLKDLRHSEHIFRLTAPGFPDVATPPATAERLSTGERVYVDVDALPVACPYRGLFAFREADAPFFFGREAFTELLEESAAAAPMVGLIGPSGSGKSSVVFAGLVPRLRQAGNGGWTVLEMRPGSRPYHALAATLLPLYEFAALTETDRLAEINKLAGYLRDGSISPGAVLSRIGDKHPDLGRLLLVADQFEELYTLCPDEAEHRAFQDLLFAAAFDGNGGPPLTLALTLRADFMGHALAYRAFADAIQKHDVKLGPMTREELARAVRLPAETQGRAFETGLVERIIDDVGGKAGTLPLLEFALTKLWEEQTQGWLTHEAYEAIGRVEGAVARHADGVYARLGEPEQVRARRVFVQLVQPGEGTEDTRRMATHEELAQDWELVQQVADARLVTTSRDEAGRETAEVVHEAMIRSWGRLREWMNADRRFRTWQERLRHALRQWEATGHDDGALLRGAPLAEAEGWAAERGGEMTVGEQAFLAAGVAARDQAAAEREAQRQRELELERRRAEEQAAAAQKLRVRAMWLATALVVAGIAALAAVAFGQRARQSARQADHDARVASARELAGAAADNLAVDPELSLLLTLEAASRTWGADRTLVPEVSTALHTAVIRNSHPFTDFTVGITETYGIAFSPDGARLATGSADGSGTAKVWDVATGRQQLTLTGPKCRYVDIAFSPDGTRLATGSCGHTAKIWDASSGKELATLTGHAPIRVYAPAFSPDGKRLAMPSDDKTVRVWDAVTGQELLVLSGQDRVAGVAFDPDGGRLATEEIDGPVRIWDATTGKELLQFGFHSGTTGTDIAFSPDGQRVVTTGWVEKATVWDATTGSELMSLAGRPGANLSSVAYSPDGKRVAARDGECAVVWDATSGQQLVTLCQVGSPWSIAFSPDGTRLATGGKDGRVRLWDVTPGTEADFELLRLRGHTETVSQVAFSPDGERIGTVSFDHTAKLWDAATGALLRTFAGPTGVITATAPSIAFSPDGGRLATVWDRSANVWDVSSGERVLHLAGHDAAVQNVAFSPDGTRLATASDDKTGKVWDATTGRELFTLRGHTGSDNNYTSGNNIAFSPDGKILATTGPGGITKLWDAATGRELSTLSGHIPFLSGLAFDPSGSHLATVGGDDASGIAILWDVSKRKELLRLAPQRRALDGVAYSPDGRELATNAEDGTVTVSNAVTGDEQFHLQASQWYFRGVAFSSDGGRLATANGDGTAGVYLTHLDDLITLARSRLTRTLTPAECRQYLHVDACPEGP